MRLLPSPTGDPLQISQIFRNILENSLQAAKDPARIEVACSDAELAGRPAIRLAFRNNGPGFSPEEKQRIFEPFFTTKTHGTGLGMTIAKRLVEAHEGTIEVGGDQSQGADIIVTLPRGKS